MQQVIAVEIAGCGKGINQRQRRLQAVHHGDGHRAVQRHDGRGLHALEKIVEPENLRPIRIFGPRRLTMQGGDRRLKSECDRARREMPP